MARPKAALFLRWDGSAWDFFDAKHNSHKILKTWCCFSCSVSEKKLFQNSGRAVLDRRPKSPFSEIKILEDGTWLFLCFCNGRKLRREVTRGFGSFWNNVWERALCACENHQSQTFFWPTWPCSKNQKNLPRGLFLKWSLRFENPWRNCVLCSMLKWSSRKFFPYFWTWFMQRSSGRL